MDKTARKRFIMIGLFAAAVCAAVIFCTLFTPCIAVSLDGERIAYASSEESFLEFERGFRKSLVSDTGHDPAKNAEYTYRSAVCLKSKADDFVSARKKIALYDGVLSEACVLRVNGAFAGGTKTREAIESVLDRLKAKYVSGVEGEVAGFVEDVSIEDGFALPEQITGEEELFDSLMSLGYYEKEYTSFHGDTLVIVASRLGMPPETFAELNPDFPRSRIEPGTKFTLTIGRPKLRVRIDRVVDMHEQIPYETHVEIKEDGFEDDVEVLQKGVFGEKLVKKRVVIENGVVTRTMELESTTISDPVDQIERRGALARLTTGSGALMWPVRGWISSDFGTRESGSHSGIDIAAPQGSVICACDGGEVTYSGDNGLYGLFVSIDHKNGFVTRYAHMSEIIVSEGDRVTKGQIIGYVGATGNATGPHLHLEVKVKGAIVDPNLYLE